MADSQRSELGIAGQQYFAELLRRMDQLPSDQQLQCVHEYLKEKAPSLPADEFQLLLSHLCRQVPGFDDYWVNPGARPIRSDSVKNLLASTAGHTPSDRTPASLESLRGTFVGRYRIDELLGIGGFGEVWKGHDPELNRTVAIKLGRRDLILNESILTKQLSEARKAASMSHGGIVQVYDIASAEDGYVIVSEYIEGESLSKRLQRGPVTIDFAVSTVIAVAKALHHAHVRDIVHRDVKPGNILLRTNGEAVLADFGLAISEQELIAETGTVSGTIRFMSPEQARGEGVGVDHRSDLFSLGLVLYFMLAGRLPYPDCDSKSYLRTVASRPPRPLGSVVENLPAGLDQICMKCLAFTPEARYSSCHELAEELEEWRKKNRGDSNASALAKPELTRNFPRQRVLLTSALISVLLVGIVAWQMKRHDPAVAVTNPPPDSPSQPDSGAVKPAENKPVPHSEPRVTAPRETVPPQAAAVPVIQLTDSWTPLLKEMPQLVSWESSAGREAPLFDRQEPRLSIKSPRSRWVYRCADIESQPIQLRTVLSVDRWEGYAGVIWGLREDPAAFPEVHYQCLSAEYICAGPGEPSKLVARSMLLKRHSFDDVRITKSATLASQVIPRPTESELPFEVEIRPTGVTMRLGSEPTWEARDSVRGTAWLPSGQWAVGVTGYAPAVSLRSLAIRSLPGDAQ